MTKRKSVKEMRRQEWKVRLVSAGVIVAILIIFFLIKMVAHYVRG